MPKTVELTDIKIKYWTLDVEGRNVAVSYYILDSDSNVSQEQDAIFWETIPEPTSRPGGGVDATPDNWYQLPAGYISTLVSLTVDIRAGLLHLINE